MKSIPLHWQILISMAIGILIGIGLSALQFTSFAVQWIKPLGTIFINLLKLMAVPLVLTSLIKGITGLKDVRQFSSIGIKTILIYLFTTVVAISIGLVCVNAIQPGKKLSAQVRTELQTKFAEFTLQKSHDAQQIRQQSPLQPLVDAVPENIFKATTDNRYMLQVIVFAVLFSFAMLSLPETTVLPIQNFFDALHEIITKMVMLVMRLSPLGVFALMAALIAEIAGNQPQKAVEILTALLYYTLTVIVGLSIMIFVIYPLLLIVFTKQRYSNFIKGIFPAQLMAFSTSSSAATLPVTMNCMEKHFSVKPSTLSFVLPLGATINMDGTSLYQGVAAVFIAHAYGIDLSIADQLGIILTATLASIGAAAVPGAGLVMLVIVLEQAHIPVSGLALIFAPDRLLDMFRTTVNVTGDMAVCLIVDKNKTIK
ncbi:MAG: dicarboxylate/amino acid:cation symporter [Cytophagales bacterium]|nr:dicarboxylate/amino acid:cation symporter [Cytophagales bacterium]MDW8384224.1 dicarboxylate/amino acid:cation symporter [Flammeovirgaceae bacterium]